MGDSSWWSAGPGPRRRVAALLVVLLAAPAGAAPATEADRALAAVRAWVNGVYDNSAQAEADLANAAVPDDQKHRVMYQRFTPVTVPIPAIPGYLVFQQSSVDGSEDPETITRVGLLQFLADPAAGVVRQRELNFIDPEPYKNAQRDPARLASLTLAQFRVDPACDFPLRLNAAGTELYGPMAPGACRFFSRGLNKELAADDAVWISAGEYWFLGRFVDAEGNVAFGNASPEPVKLIRKRPD